MKVFSEKYDAMERRYESIVSSTLYDVFSNGSQNPIITVDTNENYYSVSKKQGTDQSLPSNDITWRKSELISQALK